MVIADNGNNDKLCGRPTLNLLAGSGICDCLNLPTWVTYEFRFGVSLLAN